MGSFVERWVPREVPAARANEYVERGWWDDRTLGMVLLDGLREAGGLPFTVRSDIRPAKATFAEVLDLARRVAAGLEQLGVGAGDVVAFQLPNWLEAGVTFYAAALLGCVVAPVVHFYGRKELSYILRDSGARVLVTADTFGHLDYLATLDDLRPQLPDLEYVVVVGDGDRVPSDAIGFDALVESAATPLGDARPVDPTAPALVAYTSGTTSDPKGVVHTHRTIGFEIRQLAATQPDSKPMLVGAPVGHGIGMLAALLLPVQRRIPIHLIDVWDPGRVLAAMLEDQVLSGHGATYFLTSLLDHPDFGPAHQQLMSHIGLGGAPVPAAVGERAAALGISTIRMYGSTEHPSITGCTHADPAAKRLHTDGRPLPGVEVRLAGDGEIVSRGPDCFAGYTTAELTARVFDDGGWYHTGDVGVFDGDGFLTITDRKADVIIRGGENVSPAEVEEVLARLDSIAEVAVVAAPDARLGEHGCAFVRLHPGGAIGLLDLRAALEDAGVARQKWPEDVRVVEDFPRTASGKIQKFALRAQLRAEEGIS
jgi:acyl-CoA synthetase (AMP-forming)/AMP-acid ligase II